MRVLLSLGNRSRESSSNSDSNNEHPDIGVTGNTTNDESTRASNYQSSHYRFGETSDTTDSASLELLLDNKPIEESSEQLAETSEQGIGNSGEYALFHSGPDTTKTLSQSYSRKRSATVGERYINSSTPSTSETIELANSKSNEESINIYNEAAPDNKSKRVRSKVDSEYKVASIVASATMAVGGIVKGDSDDEVSLAIEQLQQNRTRRFWVEPAENEPPHIIRNNPVAVPSSASDPSDDDRELSPSSATVENRFDCVASTESDDSAEDIALTQFVTTLKKQGLEMIEQEGDGNCLFRAVSLQVYGSADNHSEVREQCMDYMAKNEEHFSNFIAASSDDEVVISHANNSVSPFQVYIARKRMIGVHGNHTEIQALSELFNRPVEVYMPASNYGENADLQPMNIFHEEYKTPDPPIRLSYHDGNHYNAIIDPLVPTAGLGLGLPGLKPGLADQMQVTKAITESDQLADEFELKRILKESQVEVLEKADEDLQKVLKESSRDFVSFSFPLFSSMSSDILHYNIPPPP
jgi:OTU-like cysteine protease